MAQLCPVEIKSVPSIPNKLGLMREKERRGGGERVEKVLKQMTCISCAHVYMHQYNHKAKLNIDDEGCKLN